MAELTVTKDNFESEIIGCEKTVLLDFWAEWCAPCRMLSPVISEIAQEYADTVKVGKINVDEQPELAAGFRVSSIPTVVIIKDGKIAEVSVGYRSKEEIEKLIK